MDLTTMVLAVLLGMGLLGTDVGPGVAGSVFGGV
jgi:hypothetical protein